MAFELKKDINYRLLTLLDTGSSAEIRATAADQIGQLAAKTIRRDAGVEDVLLDAGKVVVGKSSATEDWQEVLSVVGRVLPFLRSKSSETRTAASRALSQISCLVPVWSPYEHSLPGLENHHTSEPPFPAFSLANVLRGSRLLLASSGEEYGKGLWLGTPADVERARKEALGRLGLGFLEAVDGEWTEGLVQQEDVKMDTGSEERIDIETDDNLLKSESPTHDMHVDIPVKRSPSTFASGTKFSPATSPGPASLSHSEVKSSPSPAPEVGGASLSARELNRLKRKRKPGNTGIVAASASKQGGGLNNKVRVVASHTDGQPEARPIPGSHEDMKHRDLATPSGDDTLSGGGGPVAVKENATKSTRALTVPDGAWVWQGVVDMLEVDLLNPNWEVRHGAALGLREVVKSQGASGGMRVDLPAEQNAYEHERWCNDIAAKLLCVFALDRFGDFVSDSAVAPVRETASQSLASLLLHMPLRSVYHVHTILLDMVHQNFSPDNAKEIFSRSSRQSRSERRIWEVMHAGLLGIKYEVAVRRDLIDPEHNGKDTLKGVVDAATIGLKDPNDDVQSEAASCLLPIVSELVQHLPDYLETVLNILWDAFVDLKDDLGSSIAAVMELLGIFEVIAVVVRDDTEHPLRARVSTLYPLFRHTLPSVRLSVVKTLQSFLNIPALSPDWISGPLLRLLFQNIVLEERPDIRESSLNDWRAAIRILRSNGRLEEMAQAALQAWFELVLNPLGTPIDSSLLLSVFASGRDSASAYNVDKSMLAQDFSLISVDAVLQGRLAGAGSIAFLMHEWSPSSRDVTFLPLLDHYVKSPSALQRTMSAIIIEEWARFSDASSTCGAPLTDSSLVTSLGAQLLNVLETGPLSAYYEMTIDLSRLRTESQALLDAFRKDPKIPKEKVPVLSPAHSTEEPFTADTVHDILGPKFESLKPFMLRKKKDLAALEDKRQLLAANLSRYTARKEEFDVRLLASAGSAAVAIGVVPSRLNPLIRSLVNGVKNEELQTRFARAIATFIRRGSLNITSVPSAVSGKVVKNLCTFLCQDDSRTPLFDSRMKEGIITLRSAGSNGAKTKEDENAVITESSLKLQRRGCESALRQLAHIFGPDLVEGVPALWEAMADNLVQAFKNGDSDGKMELSKDVGQSVIDSFEVLSTVVGSLDHSLYPRITKLLRLVTQAARSSFAVVRSSAAACFAALCDVLTSEGMHCLIEDALPFLGDPKVVTNRQGVVEMISNVLDRLGVKALPYIIFLVVPILGRMSDADENVRLLATNVFASLVKMVPLESGLPDPPDFSPDMLQRRVAEREFLSQLLDGSKVQTYPIPVLIKADLRPYQQEGVNWLAFLARYHLHGILCDDMGLGKTLQSICILASKHHERTERYAATKSPDAVHLPSLVVCPPTLIGHWYHEILNYTTNLRPIQYTGNSRDRQAILGSLSKYDIVILSYDVIRNDIADLSRFNWHYCILDEGHIIKNGKAKITKAVKQVHAEHRLILSGTPIQNNVLELWSLFDFLMPGFLGTEQAFNERFGKPILASRDKKGILALEALHKQVLPFLLRRLKEDVLKDLPPKIIQDYYCDLSELQQSLYDDFSKSQAGVEAIHAAQGAGPNKQHIFQSLQYLRKLCNHPALVLKASPSNQLFHGRSIKIDDIRKLENAPKLQALRQILTDCGVGTSDVDESYSAASLATTSQHRVLIFCQMKQMIDIIENDLFKAAMPTVTYMRLDGTTDATKRHAIVQTFNADPTIDCLLLTTHVGGLGLNLTGADTVIFVEHDWNPMKDLQAMDRAHRLGQKKVVNVYRLITKGTLEEKIMGLQRFKLNIANSVVNQQNTELTSMDTELVLDLFRRTTDEEDTASSKRRAERTKASPTTQKNVLDGLDELPAEDEYAGQDFASFMSTLKR
ncbi:SNF2 superfamily chromatin remodeling protein [Calocera viscosa TUFC12733]|uniref:SNF2 superfamily chromatin remodeling protein n=1 Tax=Calocera viscosa (strain TUFC12733) TaxID=1330018 RepID=A0A167NNE9_CALVF|nr:SNF2 superfamily chromatin remodeling protein [Calocera viscosa TUFC12733]